MIELYNGDCMDILPKLEAGSVDLIACDLPYGITARNKWDTVIPISPLWEEYKRVAKKNAAIVLTATMPFGSTLIQSNLEMFRYDLIWDKALPVGFLNANRMPLRRHEHILIFYRSLPVYNPQKTQGKPYIMKQRGESKNYGKSNGDTITDSNGDRYPVSILRFPKDNARLHPTQKPVALMKWIIETYSNPGDTVLDTAMGSGTTGVAAVQTGRRFIGIEMDKSYFDLAQSRIENTNIDFRGNIWGNV